MRGGGENVFDAKKISRAQPDSISVFRVPLRSLKKIQDPPSNIIAKIWQCIENKRNQKNGNEA